MSAHAEPRRSKSGQRVHSAVDLLGIAAYLETNRTRPASVRKDMHTWAGLLFSGTWH